MIRRSLPLMLKRTVVRDPRKKAAPMIIHPVDNNNATSQLPSQQTPLPIAPPQHQQPPSAATTLGFYMLAGIGVSLGFALVGAILG